MHYEYQAGNYKLALKKQIIRLVLGRKKLPAIKPISEDFSNERNSGIHDSEKNLVQ